jgi:hypothetical protein
MAPASFAPLEVRKLADKSQEERIKKYDPDTGAPKLVNPTTPGDDHEAWPFAGLEIVGEAPKRTRVAYSWVTSGMAEGWLELEGITPVHKPGGPTGDPWRVTHTFLHAEALVLKCVDGEVRYRVTRQPDKYGEDGKPSSLAGDPTSSVDWFYELQKEG